MGISADISYPEPFEFPMKKRFQELYDDYGRLLRLMQDYETLINSGMDPVDAAKVINKLESQYLSLGSFR